MDNILNFVKDVYNEVPAYRDFVSKNTDLNFDSLQGIDELPILTKKNYLLEYEIQQLCRNGSLRDCHLIGTSSGFSKSGSVFWPKRPKDELDYMNSLESMLRENYHIDTKRTMIFCCMALGSWIGGMTISATLRVLSAKERNPITVATPGLNISEAVEMYAQIHCEFEQVLWITNPSNINIITSLLKRKNFEIKPASHYFPVVGEYYPEAFREKIALNYGHPVDEPMVVWTGYGSADTGDIGVETKETIALRKFFSRNKVLRDKFFASVDTPMILAAARHPYLEIIDGQIVVTKDQMIPLIRYNTGDSGGLLNKNELSADEGFPKELIECLPNKMVYVYGRASDTIIFYGTNLNIVDIHNHLLSLSAEFGYEGLFQVKAIEKNDVTFFNFDIFVNDFENAGLRNKYQEIVIDFLKAGNLEFKTKYINLTASVGEDLIKVTLDDIRKMEGNIKHKFIID